MPPYTTRLLLAVSLMAFAGCAGAKVRPPAPAATADLTAEGFVALVRNLAQPRPLAGRAALSVTQPQKQSANLAFIVAPPDRLRVEAATLFGITLATFAADGARFSLFQYGENRYYMGAASSSAVRRIFLVPLAPREFVTLATGAPALDGYALVAGSFTAGKAAYAANFADAAGKVLTVVVERETALVREVFYRYGGRTLHIVFETRRDTELGPLPEKVRLEGGDELQAELSFGRWNFSLTPDADTFVLPPPPGAEVFVLGTGHIQESK